MKSSITYLIEIRARLLRVVAVWGVIACVLSIFSNTVYTTLARPLLHQLHSQQMIATSIMTPLFVPLQSALIVSVYLAIPVLLYQIVQFMKPALYSHERQWIYAFTLLGTLLFYVGSLFAYFVVLPLLFGFLTRTVPAGVTLMPDMESYFDCVVRLLLVFGAAFEVPVVIIALVKTGLVSCEALTAKRPYVIVGSFVVGMLLTPPDVISQILLAVPLWGLFELGILLSTKRVNHDATIRNNL